MRTLQVEFITSEADQDIIVSFAIAPLARKSLTLLRSPLYEHLLPKEQRGTTVAPLDATDVATDFLVSVHWLGLEVIVKTQRHEYTLDISAVGENEVLEAKAILRQMVQDGSADVDGV